jgi:hypothetical protein
MHGDVRGAGVLLGEREQGIALGATDAAARVLAEEENDESENQTETDHQGERDDRHGRVGLIAV